MSAQEESVMGQHSSKSTGQHSIPKSIEDLPDDALFLIFTNLDCFEIINTVSSVCQRWRELAFHHSVWVNRHVKATEIGGQTTLQKLLNNISVLHTLDLTRTTVYYTHFEILLGSNIRIRNLKLHDCTIHPKALSSVVTVLNHLSENLEGLSIELPHDWTQPSTKFKLNKMLNLRRLTLVGDLYLGGNQEEPYWDFPELVSLDLSRYVYSDPWRYVFVSHLIDGSKGKLRELHLPFYCNTAILKSATQCKYVTVVSLQLEYLTMISQLPLIRSLTVRCESSADPPSTWIRPKNLNELTLYLRRPKESSINFLKKIKTENLTLISDNLCKELEHFCSGDIKRLILRCYFLRLRHLVQTISREVAMPSLEYLDIRECFLGKGVPPKILATLKGRLPRLVVRSDRFLGYQKVRELRNNVECILQESTDCSDTD